MNRMSNCTLTRRITLVVTVFALVSVLGCTGGSSGLPETVTVQLPDGTQAEATLGAGVLSLADTTWEFKQVYGSGTISGTPFMTISFGPEGELTSFENNTIAAEMFGDTILFDGERHSTSQEGVTYAAATFGAETSDASGFTFVGNLNAFAPVIGKVATATATATGEYDPDDPNAMTGTFTFEGEVLVEMPGAPTEPFLEEFSFVANRVE